MAKNDIVLLDNPTVVGIQQKLIEHDERFDEIHEKLDEHDDRFDKLDDHLDREFSDIRKQLKEHDERFDALVTDMQEVRTMLQTIQKALLPQLDKLAAL